MYILAKATYYTRQMLVYEDIKNLLQLKLVLHAHLLKSEVEARFLARFHVSKQKIHPLIFNYFYYIDNSHNRPNINILLKILAINSFYLHYSHSSKIQLSPRVIFEIDDDP